MPSPSQHRRPSPPSSQAPELVDPTFLLKGLGVVFGSALILAYITLCVVYARSQWQLVLHPSRTLTTSPAAFGLPSTEVHFGADSSGEPQLDGWWIPADATPNRTVLLLHSATGNMADALGTASMLHQLGLNVLLFDYRGYGRSGGDHPTESRMAADAHAALDYLLQTRHLPASSLIVYGRDLGAPLALELCATAKLECPALILDAPDGDLQQRASSDLRSRAVPVASLFQQRFPLAQPLSVSLAPKLLVLYSNNQPSQSFRNAKDPKMFLAIQPGDAAALRAGIQRFLEDHNPQN